MVIMENLESSFIAPAIGLIKQNTDWASVCVKNPEIYETL